MPASEMPGLWTLAFLGALGVVIAWVLVRGLAAQPKTREAPPRSPANAQPMPREIAPPLREIALPAPGSAAFPEDMMRQTARELAARLDSKIRLLESLVRDADQAAARLEAATAAAEHRLAPQFAPGACLSAPSKPAGRWASERDRPPECLPGQAAGLKDTTRLVPGAMNFEISRAAVPTSLPGSPSASASAGSPRYQPVHSLADQGCSAEEIAHRTGIPLGEVQLVLNLRCVQPPAGVF